MMPMPVIKIIFQTISGGLLGTYTVEEQEMLWITAAIHSFQFDTLH
jgi:hypothetical protein